MTKGQIISKAIREKKVIIINYENSKNEKTTFWCAIYRINIEEKKFLAKMYNFVKEVYEIEQWISFERIISAHIVEFTSYEIDDKLINYIENNLDKLQWLEYQTYDNNLLEYYKECSILDVDPYQKEFISIPGLDIDSFKEYKDIELTEEQVYDIVNFVFKKEVEKENNSYIQLAMNVLSLTINKKNYVVAYFQLDFDPTTKKLTLEKNLRINPSFLIEGRKENLSKYISSEYIDDFANNYLKEKDKYHELLASRLKNRNLIDTRPYLMLLFRDMNVDLSVKYDVINQRALNKNLNFPLKAFFGMYTRQARRKVKKDFIFYDNKININQIRVLFNALNNSITYVQGPPGTGKTSVISNVILSYFFGDKKVLVCSGNNKPVTSILEKIKLTYRDEEIIFPFLRLGNNDEVKKAMSFILEMYEIQTNKKPEETKLNRLVLLNDQKIANLIHMLETYEEKLNVEEELESFDKILNSLSSDNSELIRQIQEKKEHTMQRLESIEDINEKEINDQIEPVTESYLLQQYFCYKSLLYFLRLKQPKYAPLISICKIPNEDDRIREFNSWTKDDSNMKLLTDVFPVIFTTNISSSKLGYSDFMFDLVIMDEAAQCNVAHSLLPLTMSSNLLLVGDPKQLKPVIILETKVNNELMEKYSIDRLYSYKDNSIFDVMTNNDSISKNILLKNHYRCGRKIIDFSNQRYYNNSLSIIGNAPGELEFLNCKNVNNKNANESIDETLAIMNYIKQIDNGTSIFIITPFRAQEELLKKYIESNNYKNVKVGTIHSIQGAQSDFVIFSTAITGATKPRTYGWIKNNYEVINVAVTRAIKKLIIAGDMDAIEKLSKDKKDDLYNLCVYVINNGNYIVPKSEITKIEIGKSNNSYFESEFYETLKQVSSNFKDLSFKRNVALTQVFPFLNEDKIKEYEFDSVLFLEKDGKKKAVAIFEIDGVEHYIDQQRILNDEFKKELCNEYKIKLLKIPNYFVKEYNTVKSLINSIVNNTEYIQERIWE